MVAVSGCVDNTSTSAEQGGVAISEFKVSDDTLSPGQRAQISLKLENRNQHQVKFQEISLYNTAELNVSEKSCSRLTLSGAEKGYVPKLKCGWIVEAPADFDNSGFESKHFSIKLKLAYNSTLSNQKNTFNIKFKPIGEIEKSAQKKQSYTNGEVVMKVAATNPSTMEGTTLKVMLDSRGSGRVEGDYNVSFRPQTLFRDCKSGKKVETVVEDRAKFNCKIVPGSSRAVTRHIEISTSYKYVKAPSLNIEVVNPQ